MSYNCKNYKENGGDVTVINGKLILNGAEIKQGVAVADAASAPTKAEFNALLAALRGAGIIASE